MNMQTPHPTSAQPEQTSAEQLNALLQKLQGKRNRLDKHLDNLIENEGVLNKDRAGFKVNRQEAKKSLADLNDQISRLEQSWFKIFNSRKIANLNQEVHLTQKSIEHWENRIDQLDLQVKYNDKGISDIEEKLTALDKDIDFIAFIHEQYTLHTQSEIELNKTLAKAADGHTFTADELVFIEGKIAEIAHYDEKLRTSEERVRELLSEHGFGPEPPPLEIVDGIGENSDALAR